MRRGTNHNEHQGEHQGEAEQPEALRQRVLRAPCAFCGQGRGHWCVDAGGRELRNIYRQHGRRYQQAQTTLGELRAVLAKQRLI